MKTHLLLALAALGGASAFAPAPPAEARPPMALNKFRKTRWTPQNGSVPMHTKWDKHSSDAAPSSYSVNAPTPDAPSMGAPASVGPANGYARTKWSPQSGASSPFNGVASADAAASGYVVEESSYAAAPASYSAPQQQAKSSQWSRTKWSPR